MLEAVIFDMDGVIVDTEPHSEKHLRTFIETKGFNVPENFHSRLVGRNNRDVCSIILNEFPINLSIEQLMKEVSDGYLDYLKTLSLKPIPGVRELIGDISDTGLKTALASSASRRRIDFMMDQLELVTAFPVKISGYEVKKGKPDPEIFLCAAEKISVAPVHCLVIEDAFTGVLAAKKAGMKCVGYTGNPHNKQDLSAADLIVRDFAEINVQVLKQLY